jgi:uncharacterized protein involved in cysteine biosynthesis
MFLIPALLALIIYSILGYYFLSSSMDWAQALIFKYIISKEASLVLYYIVSGLLMFLFYVLVSWTFVLIVGILSAPFNDVISARIEKKMRGEVSNSDKSRTLQDVFRGLMSTLFTELKKIMIIILATIVATLLNFIPLFYPVVLILLALLMSAQYLDFTWSRHNLSASDCFRDLLKYFFSHTLSGLIFLGLIAIPFINALIPAIATSYYTILWTRRQPNALS